MGAKADRGGGKLCLARYLIVSKGDVYDPRVASRILCAAKAKSAADYIDLLDARRSLFARTEKRIGAL